MSDEEKNENSVLKGRSTKYITRRLEWHAICFHLMIFWMSLKMSVLPRCSVKWKSKWRFRRNCSV